MQHTSRVKVYMGDAHGSRFVILLKYFSAAEFNVPKGNVMVCFNAIIKRKSHLLFPIFEQSQMDMMDMMGT